MSGHRRSGPNRRLVPRVVTLHATSLLGVVSLACLTIERGPRLHAGAQIRTYR